MREIKFKALHKPTGSWKAITLVDIAILAERFGEFENFRQYTGLKDKKGKEIYDADKLKVKSSYGYNTYTVSFKTYEDPEMHRFMNHIGWICECKEDRSRSLIDIHNESEII